MCQDNIKSKKTVSIIANEEIAAGVYQMVFREQEIAERTKPGQFVNVYCQADSRILPRPISICQVEPRAGLVTIVYMVVGQGTKEFSNLQAGQTIDVLGPLGNGFSPVACEESILVGGGVGTPPLLELVKQLPGTKHVFLGFRTGSYLVDAFKQYAQVYIATDDGSVGQQGTVIDLMNAVGAKGQQVYACGPKPMLAALKTWTNERDIPAQLSLEERMGCGIGACVGCVCKVKTDTESGFTYKKVCKDGPVFDAKEVIL
ncbi:dihydroorotate dehydrogenase electron transfer subunit [Vallitalea pronyensis]|uniref:Dihydroorotate dehydrogenase B (NAD(+)), electron transfer subunit n=1 Tax=Vallitalea pronyensis TaxID=1348613 RepID=A0A8J8SFQ6_9FIRM|nr:dihydroorotate dehydrogenase electron transfer subunit [Vallitalea pronyensis]QUI21940.1 dihydroorotate dehydrogenase electron transfer subunit [Vallitalea pronyensis]